MHANAPKTLIEAHRALAFNGSHGVRTRGIRTRHVGLRRAARAVKARRWQARHPRYAEERQ